MTDSASNADLKALIEKEIASLLAETTVEGEPSTEKLQACVASLVRRIHILRVLVSSSNSTSLAYLNSLAPLPEQAAMYQGKLYRNIYKDLGAYGASDHDIGVALYGSAYGKDIEGSYAVKYIKSCMDLVDAYEMTQLAATEVVSSACEAIKQSIAESEKDKKYEKFMTGTEVPAKDKLN